VNGPLFDHSGLGPCDEQMPQIMKLVFFAFASNSGGVNAEKKKTGHWQEGVMLTGYLWVNFCPPAPAPTQTCTCTHG